MPEYTENYGLTLPLKTENYDLDHMTDSMEIIDTELKRVDDKAQEVEQDLTQHKLVKSPTSPDTSIYWLDTSQE